MTKFKRLTRGIKLLREHVYDPLTAATDLLTKSGLPVESYKKENGTFRINLTFPLVPSGGSSVTAPFILPPLQEDFNLSDYLIPGYELVEISIAQDTRCEPAYLNDIGVFQARGEATPVKLFIREKVINPSSFDGFKSEVYSVNIPEISLINEYARQNPFVQSGMAIPFRHDRSYLVELQPGENRALWSVVISLKFKTTLTERDQLNTQNNSNLAGRNFVPQGIAKPAGNSPILADGASGVNTGFKLVDTIIDNKLSGGLTRGARSRYAEGLRQDACYDVIAVPMFGLWGCVPGGKPPGFGGVKSQSPASMPWASAGVGNFVTMDRALVRLQYPISIHHVILAVNNDGTGSTSSWVRRLSTDPAKGAAMTNEVGIGLLSGIRSDDVQIKQVANLSWTPATIGSHLIDRGDFKRDDITIGNHQGYSWDLLSCPIVTGPGGPGTGYFTQGEPMFAAEGVTGAQPRAFPVTAGAEQVLDIRWKISDSVTDVATWAGTPEIIVGYRGHWIYLICKKMVR